MHTIDQLALCSSPIACWTEKMINLRMIGNYSAKLKHSSMLFGVVNEDKIERKWATAGKSKNKNVLQHGLWPTHSGGPHKNSAGRRRYGSGCICGRPWWLLVACTSSVVMYKSGHIVVCSLSKSYWYYSNYIRTWFHFDDISNKFHFNCGAKVTCCHLLLIKTVVCLNVISATVACWMPQIFFF